MAFNRQQTQDWIDAAAARLQTLQSVACSTNAGLLYSELDSLIAQKPKIPADSTETFPHQLEREDELGGRW